jgi:CHAT domain-containing protein
MRLKRGVRGSKRVITLALAIPLFGVAATQAIAAGPETYCGEVKFSGFGRHSATSVSIEQATAAAEAMFESRDTEPTNWRGVLTVADTPGAVPSPDVLSAYCSAAGESAWVTGLGEPSVARTFLESAFLYADRARSASLAATAAYRLSHVVVIHSSVGGSNTTGADVSGDTVTADIAALPYLTCPSVAKLLHSEAPLSLLACAAQKSAEAGEWKNSSQADLELARRLTNDATGSGLIFYIDSTQSMIGGDEFNAFELNLRDSREDFRQHARLVALDGLTKAQKIVDPRERMEFLGRLVEAALDAGETDNARLIEYASMMRSTTDNEPATEAYADAVSGRLALASGDSGEASALFKQAIFNEIQRARPERLADWYLLMSNTNLKERPDLVRSAYIALEGVRPVLPPHDPLSDESTFALRMQPVFEAAVDVQLAKKSDDSKDDDSAVIPEAQKIYEAFREAEIQNVFYGDNCIPSLPPVRPDDLNKGEIILYPILLNDRIELIYAEGGHKQFGRLPPNRAMNRDKVQYLAAKLRASLVNSAHATNDNDQWKSASRDLYNVLIAPIQSKLKPEFNLTIVPDSAIRTLPFAALLDSDPKGEKFLIQRTRLSIAPSLSYSQPGRTNTGRIGTVLAADLETGVSIPNGNFPALPGAYAEALAATDGDPHGVIRNFTIDGLESAMKGNHVDVLHLATHASFNGSSAHSFIVADNGAISLSELRKIIARNRARGDVLDLLVLSACETAEGDDEASMGLAGAAVQAGARSALATVWQVDANATVDLMKNFYRGYRSGESKSGALQSAQLSFLDDQSSRLKQHPEWKNPYYWAAFTLIGGWR